MQIKDGLLLLNKTLSVGSKSKTHLHIGWSHLT
jgi:uracil DNA glycosylase